MAEPEEALDSRRFELAGVEFIDENGGGPRCTCCGEGN